MEVKGYWDGSFKDNGKNGCGVVVKVVDRERWVTISKIAILLKAGTAMAAEVAGACVLTGILDLLQMLVSSEFQSVYQSNPQQTMLLACGSRLCKAV